MVRKKESRDIITAVVFSILLGVKSHSRTKSSTRIYEIRETTESASHLFRISFIRNASYPCIVFTHVVLDPYVLSNFRFWARWHLTDADNIQWHQWYAISLWCGSFDCRAEYTILRLVTGSRLVTMSSSLHEDILIARELRIIMPALDEN